MNKCSCTLCQVGRRLEKIAGSLSKEDARFLTNDVFELIEHSEMECDYRKAILGGQWPGTQEIHVAYLKWKENRFGTNEKKES